MILVVQQVLPTKYRSACPLRPRANSARATLWHHGLMIDIFGQRFEHLPSEFEAELQSLSLESAIYNYLWHEEDHEFWQTRIRFRPDELVKYVDAMRALDEFYSAKGSGLNGEAALGRVSNMGIRARVRAYNEWAAVNNYLDQLYCPAAFMGEDLEDLICSVVPGRAEVLGREYAHDRRYLLKEILSQIPQSVSYWSRPARSGIYSLSFDSELTIRDIAFVMIRGVFPDALVEDPTEKHAGRSKNIDLVIPAISTLIEFKYIKPGNRQTYVDELKVDIVSYPRHSACGHLFCVIWDPQQLVTDRKSVVEDLAGPRTHAGRSFTVEVVFIP
jgi:hypothetical protein